MKRARRIVLVALLAIAASGAGAFVLGALVPRPLFSDEAVVAAGETRRILLLSSPIHTDIALPADPDIVARFAFLAEAGLPVADPAVRWIVAGWGGRAFYLETPNLSDIRPGPLFKGITLDRAAMHVELAGDIPLPLPRVRAVDLDPAAFERIVAHVEASFTRAADGSEIAIPGYAYGEFDRFYEAEGWFNALGGCNTWTSAGLRKAGIATGLWNPLPVSLFWSLERHNPGRQFYAP
jgi:uncharacterized protein (TIGR02117 family)